MNNSERLQNVVVSAINFASNKRHEMLTPEHILMALIYESNEFTTLANRYSVNLQDLLNDIFEYLDSEVDVVPGTQDYLSLPSSQLSTLVDLSVDMAKDANRTRVDIPHVLHAMLMLKDSHACYWLMRDFLSKLATDKIDVSCMGTFMRDVIDVYGNCENSSAGTENEQDDEMEDDDDMDSPSPCFGKEAEPAQDDWHKFVTFINYTCQDHNPLIGREEELQRTIEVLCRLDKNNPLYIGESGVGKTAMIYGLAQRINMGMVPDCLFDANIYMLDMATLLAGTQYRGDFEQRLKDILDGMAAEEENPIVYIDEIHNMVGAGAIGEGSLDAGNLLKPYLEGGKIRFIGATTYKEYNRYFQASQGLVRRFQQIDILEPSQEETVKILEGLIDRYESHHGVKYAKGVLQHAVEMSARYITGRFLPDKAIDLIDEAGAYRQTHPQFRRYKGVMQLQKKQTVDKELINTIVRRICKISEQAMEATQAGSEQLATLYDRMSSQIFGQDEAIRVTTEAVMVGKAGLLDADKPVASMLFVGPTGVGKTEVCRVLAKELGIELVRFDMSEYTEKHTVAKLIGSPAGYVGYEDGGLLTDAIRKTPNCVLLLDEIEKAHSDIYNILLQVMDYARLTDNKGQHADFRHVILIMTSNAGAQHATQATVGFASQETTGTAMLTAVKKTFKPEFIGRLSATVVFGDMTHEMARRILTKKLNQLSVRLAAKNVVMHVSDEALDLLLAKGFTRKNGARELDRTINSMLTPLLTREILFGRLKNGGDVTVVASEGNCKLI